MIPEAATDDQLVVKLMKQEIIETDELKIKHVKALVENGFATEFAKEEGDGKREEKESKKKKKEKKKRREKKRRRRTRQSVCD